MPPSKIPAPSAQPQGLKHDLSSQPLSAKTVTERILHILGGETLLN